LIVGESSIKILRRIWENWEMSGFGDLNWKVCFILWTAMNQSEFVLKSNINQNPSDQKCHPPKNHCRNLIARVSVVATRRTHARLEQGCRDSFLNCQVINHNVKQTMSIVNQTREQNHFEETIQGCVHSQSYDLPTIVTSEHVITLKSNNFRHGLKEDRN
jgi:hypothetical protein